MGIRNSTFGAVANDATLVQGVQMDLVVGGTFVGTIELQVAIPDASGANVWVKVGSLTAPGAITYMAGTQRSFRAACTAWTSGTIVYSLAGLFLEDHIW
jgi:hypothetical protein